MGKKGVIVAQGFHRKKTLIKDRFISLVKGNRETNNMMVL